MSILYYMYVYCICTHIFQTTYTHVFDAIHICFQHVCAKKYAPAGWISFSSTVQGVCQWWQHVGAEKCFTNMGYGSKLRTLGTRDFRNHVSYSPFIGVPKFDSLFCRCEKPHWGWSRQAKSPFFTSSFQIWPLATWIRIHWRQSLFFAQWYMNVHDTSALVFVRQRIFWTTERCSLIA